MMRHLHIFWFVLGGHIVPELFTILCDGGNDNFEKKYFGIMVRFWDEQIKKVATRFLDAPWVVSAI